MLRRSVLLLFVGGMCAHFVIIKYESFCFLDVFLRWEPIVSISHRDFHRVSLLDHRPLVPHICDSEPSQHWWFSTRHQAITCDWRSSIVESCNSDIREIGTNMVDQILRCGTIFKSSQTRDINTLTDMCHGPLTRYAILRVAHAPEMPGTFSPPPRVSDPDMHHGTWVTHVPWRMPGLLTTGFPWGRWRQKTFPAFPAHAQPAILRIH